MGIICLVFYIIFGFLGIGKIVMLVEVIKQVVKYLFKVYILVCVLFNLGVDLFC